MVIYRYVPPRGDADAFNQRLVKAIQQKDYPILQGILLFNAAFFITVAWASDLAFKWLDPRTRHL